MFALRRLQQYTKIKTIDLWLKTQPFRVTFHDILFRIALTCQSRLSTVCPGGSPWPPWNVVLVINWTACLHCADYSNIKKTIDLWLKTQPFRVTFHDILFRIALTCQCRLSIVCPRGIPGDVASHPESPGGENNGRGWLP